MSSKLTKREICLIILSVVFIAVSVILLSILVIKLHKKPKEEEELCLTKDCVMTASYFLSSLDTTIDPCQDFYHYVCNGYIEDHPVPEHENLLSTFKSYQSKLDNQIRELLENTNPTKQPDVVFTMMEAYHVCLNTSYIEDQELAAFKKFVKEELGGWPVGESESFSLEDYLGNVRRLRISQYEDIFSITFHHDVNDTFKHFLLFSGASWSEMPFLSSTIAANGQNNMKDNELRKQITNMARLFNVTDPLVLGVIEKDIRDVTAGIGNIALSVRDVFDYLFEMKKITFEDLNALTGNNIDWLRLANTMFRNIHTYKKTDIVAVSNVKFLTNMAAALRKFSSRTLKNYFVWKKINYLSNFAGPAVKKIFDDDNHFPTPRWLSCVQWTQTIFPLAVTRLFVNAHFDKNGKKMIAEMFDLVQTVYRDTILKSDWLDEETRTTVLYKVKNTILKFAYPDKIFDDNWLTNEYAYISRVNPCHFDNAIQMVANRTKNNLKYVTINWDPYKWSLMSNPLAINAFYRPNSIWLPTGILHLPFFDVNRTAAANFGSMGTVIAHEMGHAFDTQFSKFDDQGRFKPCWTDTTLPKYEQKTECLVDQYANYCPPFLQGGKNDSPICLNAHASLGDNIADNLGVQASYKAYKLWSEKHPGMEKQLPGMKDITLDQLFFISFAYMFCENVPAENWEAEFGSDFSYHSSGYYRTFGTLVNFPEFAKVFSCPESTIYNSDKTCSFW